MTISATELLSVASSEEPPRAIGDLMVTKVHSYGEVVERAKGAPGKTHLLLGNGFSIGCHPLFRYGTLYEQALKGGLSPQIQEVFAHYGTSNFEAVLKALDDLEALARIYKLRKSDISLDAKKDYESLQEALAKAIAAVHPENVGTISHDKYITCYRFISAFDAVFTLSYDLLLYWTSLHQDGLNDGERFRFGDGFGRNADTPDDRCVFLRSAIPPKQGIYFLHGALHLATYEGEIQKLVWNYGTPLITQIRMALKEKKYPLVVSEGRAVQKKERIESSSYLSHALRRFQSIEGKLVTYGVSFSPQDDHILEAIARNTKLTTLYVGLYGETHSADSERIISAANDLITRREAALGAPAAGRGGKPKELTVEFFDSGTAPVWPMSPGS
jgi:Domain of unknown function (DUF4917)